ncbi:UNVERIFIED_CONTAM: hypothetical protein FKN15_049035 [Acipenser sinensis]
MSEEGKKSPLGTWKRKLKFSEEELRVLMAEVTQHEIELLGKASANISYATKEAIWSSIVEKGNDAGVTRRTVNQVMKSYATKEAIWSSIVEKGNDVGVTRRTVNQGVGTSTPGPKGEPHQSLVAKGEPHQSLVAKGELHQSPVIEGDYLLLSLPPPGGDDPLLSASLPGGDYPLLPPLLPEGDYLQLLPPPPE